MRIERRSIAKIAEQGQTANGMEAAALLDGIANPAWYRSLCWQDFDEMTLWRADEVQLIAEPPVQRGPLREGIALSDAWWATLNTSLDALARQHTTRTATPDTEVMTEGLVAREIERAFPGRVDTSIGDPWVPAHADLNWANLTGPGECWILDWEDHGLAPRGLDAANLWASSLTIPVLANRVWSERRADLETSTGRLMALFCLAKIINDSSVPAPLHEAATGEAEALIAALGR
ncbi:hypothetical protein SAMN05216215_103315 [Saccharopolyspora shandongensis]|uniref:Phosphotransferase enzyme family protein n=1 Tax=Saccharopolyspora shandongensis TaxID=418495 RepID=A0A1H3M1R5_9PSEU|nr:hypothetical protein SAMN05216215_103315 [Saccharopolyspora shandongensis]